VKLDLTPVENLRIARALKRPRDEIGVEEALERVGLLGFEDVPVRSLSAGQGRRVALARLVATRARVWILDEPFTAIDRRGVADVEALIAQHTESGGMAVLTSHHPVRLPGCQVRNLHLVT
jgi:heme exporter protein A